MQFLGTMFLTASTNKRPGNDLPGLFVVFDEGVTKCDTPKYASISLSEAV